MTEGKQRGILILGMMRSGTSAMAGILNMLGVKFCRELIEGDIHNSEGYFESTHIASINSCIFSILDDNFIYNGNFDELILPEDNWWLNPALSHAGEEGLALIKNEFKGEKIFCLKEPQMSILFPFWIELLKEAHVEPCIIIPLRNPIETAFSLSRRNKWSPERCLFSWFIHMMNAEYNTRNCPRLFVHFDNIISGPEETVNLISEIFNITFPKDFNKELIHKFLQPSLKHHSISHNETRHIVPPFIFDFYNLLLMTVNRKKIDEEIILQFDSSRRDFYNMYDDKDSYIHHLINYKHYMTEIYRKTLACHIENKVLRYMSPVTGG